MKVIKVADDLQTVIHNNEVEHTGVIPHWAIRTTSA